MHINAQAFAPLSAEKGLHLWRRKCHCGMRMSALRWLSQLLTIGHRQFFPPPHEHLKVNQSQLIAAFLGLRLCIYSFGISEIRICVPKKHMPLDTLETRLNLTHEWNVCFKFPSFLSFFFFWKKRLPLYLLKVTKQNHFSFHYIFCLHVLSFWDLFFFSSLRLLSPSCRQPPVPPVTVLTERQERTLLQSSLWRISYKSL